LVHAGIALALTAGVVSCGSDDDDTGQSAACTSLVDFSAAASADSDTSTADGAKALGMIVAPLWEKAAPAIPAASKSDVEIVTAAIGKLANGDPEAFEADTTFEAYGRALTAAIDRCDFAERSISATESDGKYRFVGVPKKLDSGTLAVTMDNKGAEPHVMVVFRKNDGETRTAEQILALPEEEGQKAGSEVGAVFAGPGMRSVGLVSLTKGNYVYFCPIPIGGGQDGPPHFTQGMFGEFNVG
jgi:hypothetical protein